MSERFTPIQDVCWELFGGPCPVHATLDAM